MEFIDSLYFIKYKYNLTISFPFMIQASLIYLIMTFLFKMLSICSNYSCYNSTIIHILFIKT